MQGYFTLTEITSEVARANGLLFKIYFESGAPQLRPGCIERHVN